MNFVFPFILFFEWLLSHFFLDIFFNCHLKHPFLLLPPVFVHMYEHSRLFQGACLEGEEEKMGNVHIHTWRANRYVTKKIVES